MIDKLINETKQGKLQILIIFVLGFTMASCTNPFAKGTWAPLPFKKKQLMNAPADTIKINRNK
ncbi:MAG: hypothetical protein IPN61_00300 [Bacteroidetes bacterium]|jgi:hypothetical protein|nr:hypothetical protein [Bacteroidota bacterium]MBK8364204.1 hypothetical protein [Bacteroidota bacterium]MBK9411871.1 hypothetical protein [Bacteroidota bacterium]